MRFAEVEVRGYLVAEADSQWFAEKWRARAEPHNSGAVFVEPLIAQVDAAEAAGVRAILLVVDSLGGLWEPTARLYRRLRQFSEGGGAVIAHARMAGSSAWPLALAGDVVVLDPAGFFAAHGAPGDNAAARACTAEMLDIAARRSLASRDATARLLVLRDAQGRVGARVEGALAVQLGWADVAGDLSLARAVAELVAREGQVPAAFETPRRRALAERARPAARVVASWDLSDVPANVVDQARLTPSIYDRDNLWPNPSSEIAPPTGGDTTQPEWADRVNAGSGAYSGSWVRQVTAAVSGFWVPCSPGAQFYAEAQAKRTAGTGSGGRLNVGFYPTLGSFTGGTVTSGAYSTSGSWAKVTVTSAAAPDGTNAAYISYEAASGDTIQFDSLYARRVAQPEMIASETITPTVGPGWILDTYTIRKVGGLVVGRVSVSYGNANARWNALVTLPVGGRPMSPGAMLTGHIYDQSVPAYFFAEFFSGTDGVIMLQDWDNGTSLAITKPSGDTDPASGDSALISLSFPWQ